MITVIFGKNSYQRDQALVSMMSEHITNHGADSVVRFEADEAEWRDIDNALQSTSLFSSGDQMVVVRAASSTAHIRDKLEAALNTIDATTSLVLLEPEVDKRTSFFKALKKSAKLIECHELNDYEVVSWVKKESKQRAVPLEGGVAQMLVSRVGIDQRLLSNELEKLSLIDRTIAKDDVEQLVPQMPQDRIFELLDATMQGDGKKAISLYEQLRIARMEPIYIVTMLGWQSYNIAITWAAGDRSDSEVAKAAGLSPFVVSKARRIGRSLKRHQVAAITQAIADTDLTLKTKPVDDDQLVKQLILRLSARV